MRYLGIDLGGCAGNNTALVLLEDEKVVKSMRVAKQPYSKCNQTLSYLIESMRPDIIAIDAPLSIPRKLYDPTFKSFLENLNEGEITNPYLFRETDYFICKTFGLRPMPPVGDRIGRITARAIDLQRRLGCKLFEVYPKQIKQKYGINFSEDPHINDAYAAAFGAKKISQHKTIYPAKGCFVEGWIFPIL